MHEEDESEASGERWLVSYADFITLLFAFFVVLYATSVRDLEKTEKFQDSIKRFLIKAGAFGESGQRINQGDEYHSPIEPPIETFNQASPLSKDVYDEAVELIEANVSAEDRDKFVMDLVVDELGVRLIIAADPLFDGSGFKFRSDAMPFLKSVGHLISDVGRRVLIEGHHGGPKSENGVVVSEWEVGALRSAALTRYFIKIHGIGAENFMSLSLGSTRPWPGEADPNSARHRRIEMVLLTENLPF